MDHFIPFARCRNDAVFNLVAAHSDCNRRKLDFIAATPHLERWLMRNWNDPARRRNLLELGRTSGIDSEEGRCLAIARATYLHLPAGYPLWAQRDTFESCDTRLKQRASRLLSAITLAPD